MRWTSIAGKVAIGDTDASHTLPAGLLAGKTIVNVTVNWPPVEVLSQPVDLKPGMNSFDFGLF